jgi:hypothetical protein
MWDISQITAKKYYNTHKKEISFAIRDKILINVKNFRVRKPYKKLTNRYIGSFKMSKSINSNIYELELSKTYKRLYRTFLVSLLKSYSRKESEKSFKLVDLDKKNRF